MKNFTKLAVAFLICAGLARGAGTVTQTIERLGTTGHFLITVTWIGDGSNGTVPATSMIRAGTDIPSTDGYSIISVDTKPGSPAPTDLYDLTLVDEDSLDIMESACLNRSASIAETCAAAPHPLRGNVAITIANQSVASATATIKITIVPTTVAKRGTAATTTFVEGEQINFVGDTISTDSATVPYYSVGTGTPSAACTAGRHWYLDTTNIRFFVCSATDTWREVARISSGSGAPAAGACDAAAEEGSLYYRTDNTSGASGHYGCAETGSGSWGWVLLGGSGATTTTLYIPIRLMIRDSATNRYMVAMDTPTQTTLGTAPNSTPAIVFNDAADNSAVATFIIPGNWNAGQVDVIVHWTVSSASTNQWWGIAKIGCVGTEAGQDITAVSYNAATSQGVAHNGTSTRPNRTVFSNVAMTNCAANETAFVSVARDGDGTGGTDDLAANISLWIFEIKLTITL